jgi:hypothetical protein
VRRLDIYAISIIFGGSLVGASALVAATAYHSPVPSITASAAANQAPAPKPPVHVTLNIDTPAMLGGGENPAFIPSAFSLPANSDVIITVVNFDDATALPKGAEKYAVPTGTLGALSVQPMDPSKPNDETPASQVTRMDPTTGVSHTFTIAKLGLNVPIAPKSRTTFTIHTGDAGTYTWQCYVPCGDVAMATDGYMQGKLTVA